MVLCLHFSQSVCYIFFNVIPRLDPVGAVCRISDSGCRDDDGPQFFRCVEGQQLKFHENWEDGVTPKVQLSARVDVSAFVSDCFAINYLTPTWCRVFMFGCKSINGSIKWLGVSSFLWNFCPALDPQYSGSLCWLGGEEGPVPVRTWVVILGDIPTVFLSIEKFPLVSFHLITKRFFENTQSAARRDRDNLLMENHMYRIQIPSTCCNPLCGWLVNQRHEAFGYHWGFDVHQYFVWILSVGSVSIYL